MHAERKIETCITHTLSVSPSLSLSLYGDSRLNLLGKLVNLKNFKFANRYCDRNISPHRRINANGVNLDTPDTLNIARDWRIANRDDYGIASAIFLSLL